MKLISFLCFFNLSLFAHDKWIIVTTIQYPTHAVRKLAAMEGWRLVVVADKKTPQDWYLDNCDFLSVDDQLKLPYEIIQHIPWNHYSRKNIGYLYAIEHGAKVIYETDDDNVIMGETVPILPANTRAQTCRSPDHVFNIYAYFGQPSLWPRGYPLSKICLPASGPYRFAEEKTSIPIQQGLVNSDPDVDAISRLTKPFQEITFTDGSPVALAADTFCPFNSQNTTFHHAAFWGLLLPITTTFRVCDIWRGYWVQRMLWDIGANLTFLPATAIQYRNAHNLLKDFADEADLYQKTESLIGTLLGWKSTAPLLETRILQLMKALADHGFFKPHEAEFTAAWLRDLERVGYTFPQPVSQ